LAVVEVPKLGLRNSTAILDPWQLEPKQPKTVTPSFSLAQSSSGQGGNRSVPKKEREIRGVDFRVVNWLFLPAARAFPVEGFPVRFRVADPNKTLNNADRHPGSKQQRNVFLVVLPPIGPSAHYQLSPR